jgi:uncharacterized damage-inducible protein DinB
MKNLLQSDYPEYFAHYINLVENDDVVLAMKLNLSELVSFLEKIPAEKHNFKYQENKWTIKDVVRHIIDTERVFVYRALRFARFDATELAGFDENNYASNVDTTRILMLDLIEELVFLRKSSIKLFESFSDKMLSNKGIASGKQMSVLAAGFVISGHAIHHTNVLKEKYLI